MLKLITKNVFLLILLQAAPSLQAMGVGAEPTFTDAHRITAGKVQLPAEDTVLFIKTLTGKTFMVSVNPASTLTDIKNQLSELSGVPAEQQKLVLGNKLISSLEDMVDWHDGVIVMINRP